MSARVFLDWNRPFLHSVCEWLVEHRAEDGLLDLSATEILCTSRRASRRLLELLTDACDEREFAFDPPETLTVRAWQQRRAASGVPLASDLERRLAWRQSLRVLGEAQRAALAMGENANEAWITRLMELREELGWGAKDCAAAHEYCRSQKLPEEQLERWAALRDVEREYLAILERAGRRDLPEADEVEADTELFTLGLVEMPAAARRVLERHERVTHWIHAPESMADHFDELGLPLEASWSGLPLSLDESQIFVADDPAQTAVMAVDRLADLSTDDAKLCAEDFTVAIVDPECDEPFEDALGDSGLSRHDARGLPLLRQMLPRLLRALSNLLREDTARALRELLRLPEVEHALRQGAKRPPLAAFDEFQKEHLQFGAHLRESSQSGPLLPSLPQLRGMLGELTGGDRALREWQAPLLDRLRQLLEGQSFDPASLGGRHQIQLFEQMVASVQAWSQLPAPLDPAVDAATALAFLADTLERGSLAMAPEAGSIETIGWLDMAHDDAPHALLLGLNEGILPTTDSLDPLLNQAMRRALSLRHDGARLARDSFWLQSVLHSRQSCSLFVSTRTLADEPLRPSRLLFRC